jgi:hypothetical protein
MAAPFLDLFEHGQLKRVVLGIERAVRRSFETDGARMTEAEVRRRFRICERLFRQLRGDLRWGLVRVLDHLPQYLRCELDGQAWEPDRRTCWMPEDGA